LNTAKLCKDAKLRKSTTVPAATIAIDAMIMMILKVPVLLISTNRYSSAFCCVI
jgi:hypothetical protein